MSYTDPKGVANRLARLVRHLEVRHLEGSRQAEADTILNRVRETGYTTGSEWRGDLGQAIRSVEQRFELDAEVQSELDWLMSRVHDVWSPT